MYDKELEANGADVKALIKGCQSMITATEGIFFRLTTTLTMLTEANIFCGRVLQGTAVVRAPNFEVQVPDYW